jgi:hypothetical protein
MKGLLSVTFSGGMPKKSAKAGWPRSMAWFGVSRVRRSPSQAATMACSSIALWYWIGVSISVSTRSAAAARPAATSPLAKVGGLPMRTAFGSKETPRSKPMRAGSAS